MAQIRENFQHFSQNKFEFGSNPISLSLKASIHEGQEEHNIMLTERESLTEFELFSTLLRVSYRIL